MPVSRDYAMCLLFGFEFNPENVIKAKEKIASYGDLEVCFETTEKNPILVPINRIHYDPFTYKRYLQAAPRISEVENSIQLCSDSQIVQFVNAIFGVDMQAYTDYEKQRICAKDVFGIVKLYTNRFESESGFTQWCKGKVNYTQVPFSRKRNESGNTLRMRELYVLKSELHENVVKNIVTKLPYFQKHMENLKKDFVLVGYVRKSVKSAQYRVKNIQSMVNNLYLRSNVDKCFVSYSLDANSDITTRDFKDDIKTLEKIQNVHGNTQRMIDFISSSKQKVCIVIIDYAGLSTDPVNIQQFIKDNDAIEKIVIDCFPYICDAAEFERSHILDNIKTLSPFNSRKTPRQRSKT